MGTQLLLPKQGKQGTEPLWPSGWMHQDATWYGGRPQPSDFVLDGDPAPLPKNGAEPPIFDPCLLGPNGCMDQDAAWYGGRPRPRRHCIKNTASNFRPMSVVAKQLDGL